MYSKNCITFGLRRSITCAAPFGKENVGRLNVRVSPLLQTAGSWPTRDPAGIDDAMDDDDFRESMFCSILSGRLRI